MSTANTSNIYPNQPTPMMARPNTANGNRDGTGAMALVVAASAGGGGVRIDWFRMAATAVTTAGMLRFFMKDAGGLFSLVQEIAVEAVTPSGTVAAWNSDWYPAVPTMAQPSPLYVPPGCSLYVATQNSEQFNVTAFGFIL